VQYELRWCIIRKDYSGDIIAIITLIP